MIISASRRTDIPAYHSEWFFNRLNEKKVLIRNPMNFNQVSEISLAKEDVECIVFWTKNPLPMMNKLDLLEEYNFYFQFTLTSYGVEYEPGLPPKNKLLPVFKMLSEKIGAERVVWRYDPIMITEKIDVKYHIENFELLASKLCKHTKKVVISFLDEYPKIKKRLRESSIRKPSILEVNELSKAFSSIAKKYNLLLETCSEKVDLSEFDIPHGKCIDDKLICDLFSYTGTVKKDSNQRAECGCVRSIDIGAYNTCKNGCIYCYANYNKKIILPNNKSSQLITGELNESAIVKKRKSEKLFSNQIKFDFDDR